MEKRPIALITGASRGIGAAIAIGLARDGFDIWLNYRSNTDAAENVASEIERLGRHCQRLQFDVADEPAVEAALEPLLKAHVPYAVIHNAGFARDTLLAIMSREEWQSVLSVNLDGFFNITKRVLRPMLKRRQGRIVTISSTSGQTGVPGQTNYCAAKAGLIGATKSLAAEVARRNILVNAVAPGLIDTEMIQDAPLDALLAKVPMGRLGTVDEVAAVVRFLCSENASYITGQVIGVNGGVYM